MLECNVYKSITLMYIPTGPDWTNNSHISDSVTLSSNPPTYIVASENFKYIK